MSARCTFASLFLYCALRCASVPCTVMNILILVLLVWFKIASHLPTRFEQEGVLLPFHHPLFFMIFNYSGGDNAWTSPIGDGAATVVVFLPRAFLVLFALCHLTLFQLKDSFDPNLDSIASAKMPHGTCQIRILFAQFVILPFPFIVVHIYRGVLRFSHK